jgi:ProP effector
MSNASLKEQLQAVASQLTDNLNKESKPGRKVVHVESREKTTGVKTKVTNKVDLSKMKKPKPRWVDYVQYGVELLKLYFPLGFKASHEMKPLKKGIKQDLVKRLSTMENIAVEDKACMVKSLAYYVNTQSYHKSVVEGAERIDLDGNPAGVVSTEEAKYSVEKQQAKLLAKQKLSQQT